jgi:hypothetical protein
VSGETKCHRCNAGAFYGGIKLEPELDLGGPCCSRCRGAARLSNLAEAEHVRRRQVKAGRRPSEATLERLENEAEALEASTPAAVEVENEKQDRRLDDDHGEGSPPAAFRVNAPRWRG